MRHVSFLFVLTALLLAPSVVAAAESPEVKAASKEAAAASKVALANLKATLKTAEADYLVALDAVAEQAAAGSLVGGAIAEAVCDAAADYVDAVAGNASLGLFGDLLLPASLAFGTAGDVPQSWLSGQGGKLDKTLAKVDKTVAKSCAKMLKKTRGVAKGIAKSSGYQLHVVIHAPPVRVPAANAGSTDGSTAGGLVFDVLVGGRDPDAVEGGTVCFAGRCTVGVLVDVELAGPGFEGPSADAPNIDGRFAWTLDDAADGEAPDLPRGSYVVVADQGGSLTSASISVP